MIVSVNEDIAVRRPPLLLIIALTPLQVLLRGELRQSLDPASIASHTYFLNGTQSKLIRRKICTPGTRVGFLKGVIGWANDPSNPHTIYWLFGPAGTGKSTIAYTIARRFDTASVPGDKIVLGAYFFCSRQFPETREVVRVIRTIVYQLCHACESFAEAFYKHGDSSAMDKDPATQLERLLIKPWKEWRKTQIAHTILTFLVGIDALDELEDDGGSVLSRALLNVQDQLEGLKFFITSREDPQLKKYAESLDREQVWHLREIKREDADADIKTYLMAQLRHLIADETQLKPLVEASAGLFIYAATVVEYIGVTNRSKVHQSKLLSAMLSAITTTTAASTTPGDTTPPNSTTMLDKLYFDILVEALNPSDLQQDFFDERLRTLHTFLCAIEGVSPSVVTSLLNDQSNDGLDEHDPVPAMITRTEDLPGESVADDVLKSLHAVLYREGGRVMWLHKSFPDFIFNKTRSTGTIPDGRSSSREISFYCDRGSLHRILVEGCFNIMSRQLRFNIAEIPDSSIFDKDDCMLQASVEKNISPALRYACRSWSHHFVCASPVDLADVFGTLDRFLQFQVLFWIETMNLLGQRGRCEGMLLGAQKRISQMKVRDHSLPCRWR